MLMDYSANDEHQYATEAETIIAICPVLMWSLENFYPNAPLFEHKFNELKKLIEASNIRLVEYSKTDYSANESKYPTLPAKVTFDQEGAYIKYNPRLSHLNQFIIFSLLADETKAVNNIKTQEALRNRLKNIQEAEQYAIGNFAEKLKERGLDTHLLTKYEKTLANKLTQNWGK